MIRRFFPFTIGQGGGWTPITDDAIDGFGFLNFYDVQTPSFSMLRNEANETDFDWNGQYPNQTDITNYINVNPTADFRVGNIYAQKNTSANLILESVYSEFSIYDFLKDEFGTGKHAFKSGNIININGSLDTSLSKNVPYFSFTILFRANDTTGSVRSVFYISTGTNAGRARVAFNVNAEPSTGGSAGGRRATADSFSGVTLTNDFSQWSVVTLILDYASQLVTARVNGTTEGTNSIGNGSNSENTDSLSQYIFASFGNMDFGSLVIFNSAPTSFSQIEEIENRMMTFANITP